MKHGAHARREGLEVPEALAQIDADAHDWIDRVRSEQGDVSAMRDGGLRNIEALDYSIRLLAHDIKQRGLFTKHGRVRNTYPLLMSTLDRWLRYATALGLDRRPSDVMDMSIGEYAAAQQDNEGGPPDDPHR